VGAIRLSGAGRRIAPLRAEAGGRRKCEHRFRLIRLPVNRADEDDGKFESLGGVDRHHTHNVSGVRRWSFGFRLSGAEGFQVVEQFRQWPGMLRVFAANVSE